MVAVHTVVEVGVALEDAVEAIEITIEIGMSKAEEGEDTEEEVGVAEVNQYVFKEHVTSERNTFNN